MSVWLWAVAMAGDAVMVAPLREDDHPTYLDAADQVVTWPQVRDLARQTDAMRRVRRRRTGRGVLRALFTGAAAAETWATVELVNNDNDWAWVMGAQTGFTALAAGLLWADIPRGRRIDRARMLEATNAYLLTAPTPPRIDAR